MIRGGVGVLGEWFGSSQEDGQALQHVAGPEQGAQCQVGICCSSSGYSPRPPKPTVRT